jgi:Tfp pilus assembly protein PilO
MPLSGENEMKKLSAEKRNQLILVIMATAIAMIALWFGVINFQHDYMANIAGRTKTTRKKLEDVEKAVKNSDQLEAELSAANKKLADLEDDMASGDVYAWMVSSIRQFKLGYKVEIPQFSQSADQGEMNMLPKFPYKQATLTIGGTAYYYDLGKFIADLENQFPYFRVLNLSMEPAPAALASEKEKLSFRMDIVALLKPGAG